MRKFQQERLDKGLCYRCGVNKHSPNRTRCTDCLVMDAERQAKQRSKDKQLVFEAYGGYACNCCGETMKECLSIDHVDNDGYSHRKEIGKQGSAFYSWLVNNNFPQGFQVLCMNCQFGKKHNGGICPHKTK